MTSRKPSLKNIASVEPDEQTFHLMFEVHSAIMLLIEPLTGVILDANQAAVNFYGYPKSKLCRMSIQEINTLPAEQVALERQKALSEERDYFVFPHKLASGEERIVEVQSSPITLQEKDILFSIIHDITERERKRETIRVEDEYLLKQMVGFTEELLKTGTEQASYQKILENLLYISKAKYGILTLFNKNTGKFTTLAVAGLNDKIIKLSKILGFEPVGKEWNEYSIQNEKLKDKVVARFSSLSELSKRVLPETISRPIEKLLNMGEVAVTKVIVNDQMIGDFTLIMPAGKRFENDTLVNIYSRQLDMFMTRIIAGEALSESETMLKKVQGIARLGSWEIDLTTKTMIASDEAHRIYGVAQGSMTMAFVQSIPLPEFRPILDAALSALIKKGKSYDVEFKIQRISDGELRDIHSAAEYNAASQTIIGSVQDITDRKRSEESIHQRVLELETINRISLVMRSASKQNEMLAIVLNEALDI
ncbi:MAG: PAS domain S-box protein [Chloroflexi bacterium]|nr:PAS domain S-box protein [Chloroflexota bacterium]